MKAILATVLVISGIAFIVHIMKKASPSMPNVEPPDYTNGRYTNSAALPPADRGTNISDDLLGQEVDALG